MRKRVLAACFTVYVVLTIGIESAQTDAPGKAMMPFGVVGEESLALIRVPSSSVISIDVLPGSLVGYKFLVANLLCVRFVGTTPGDALLKVGFTDTTLTTTVPVFQELPLESRFALTRELLTQVLAAGLIPQGAWSAVDRAYVDYVSPLSRPARGAALPPYPAVLAALQHASLMLTTAPGVDRALAEELVFLLNRLFQLVGDEQDTVKKKRKIICDLRRRCFDTDDAITSNIPFICDGETAKYFVVALPIELKYEYTWQPGRGLTIVEGQGTPLVTVKADHAALGIPKHHGKSELVVTVRDVESKETVVCRMAVWIAKVRKACIRFSIINPPTQEIASMIRDNLRQQLQLANKALRKQACVELVLDKDATTVMPKFAKAVEPFGEGFFIIRTNDPNFGMNLDRDRSPEAFLDAMEANSTSKCLNVVTVRSFASSAPGKGPMAPVGTVYGSSARAEHPIDAEIAQARAELSKALEEKKSDEVVNSLRDRLSRLEAERNRTIGRRGSAYGTVLNGTKMRRAGDFERNVLLHELLHQLGLPHPLEEDFAGTYVPDLGDYDCNALHPAVGPRRSTIGGTQADVLRGCILFK